MPSAVGLEISDGWLRALELDGHERKQRIRRFVEVPIEGGAKSEEGLGRALATVFREERFPRGNVVVSLDVSQSILRDLTVPFVGDDQIRKTLKFNLEAYVHSHEVEGLVVDYYTVEQTEKSTQLVVAGFPKAILTSTLEALTRVKVDPVAVDLDLFALFNSASACGLIGDQINALLLDFGPRFTKLISFENGALRAARFLRLSMNGNPDAAVGSLTREINRFLLARPIHEPVVSIYLTGDCDDERFQSFSEGLKRDLGFEVVSLDARARLEHKLDDETACRFAAHGGVTLGLALKGLGVDNVGVDFRQEEFVYQRRFDAVKKSLLLCLLMLAILLGQVALYYRNLHALFGRNLGEVLDEELDQAQAVLSENFPEEKVEKLDLAALPLAEKQKKAREFFQRVDAAKRRLEESSGKGENPLPVSALEYWREMTSRLPTQFGFFTLNYLRVDLGRDRISFHGKMDDRGLADKIVKQLNEFEGFKATISQKGLVLDAKDGKYLYEIDVEVKKAEPPK